jgi:3-methylcrotonyl-CoA carboxylase beta subunit
VAHYRTPDDRTCLAKIRELVKQLPRERTALPVTEGRPPARPPEALHDLLPEDHKQVYDVREVLACILDDGELDEFQADHAPEMICGHARIDGVPVGIIANARGMLKDPHGGPPKFGGIVYADSADKVAFFIETLARHGTPILFVQDVSGFMVGKEAEHSGIIRAGALRGGDGHGAGAQAGADGQPRVRGGVLRDGGAGVRPGLHLHLADGADGGDGGRLGGDGALQRQIEALKREGKQPDEELRAKMDAVRADYDHQLDARYAAARGFVDAVIVPEETRAALSLALRTSLNNPGPHLGAFVIPPGV